MGRTSDAAQRLMGAVMELIWIGSYDGTTIEQICERAGVQKGTFYHFFRSKQHLAEAALDREWEGYDRLLDSIFSPAKGAVVQIGDYCRSILEEQKRLRRQHGFVLGCPLCTLGAEISTREKGLRRKIERMLSSIRARLESALRQGVREGTLSVEHPKHAADLLWTLHLGAMVQARVENHLRAIQALEALSLHALGVSKPAKAGRARR